MSTTTSINRAGADIHIYEADGEGTPVLLIHGFASDHITNWVGPGWIPPLRDAGFKPYAPDVRGHGRSTKFYDPTAYALDEIADDMAAVIHYIGVGAVPVIGYSMGAYIGAVLALTHPQLVSRLVLAGVGENLITPSGNRNELIARGLEADVLPVDVTDIVRRFRLFTEQTGSDRLALAACIRGNGRVFTGDDLARITAPTLVIAGSTDDVARDPQPLADMIPGARCVSVPNRDHMRAVGDKVTKREVVAFLTAT